MKEAYGFVYETINLINGMKYIGKASRIIRSFQPMMTKSLTTIETTL
jgi:hypothetical protein